MKTLHACGTILTLLSASASAQLLSQGDGALPQCAQQCGALTQAQTKCGSSWACFCPAVWASSNGDLTTVCAASCPDPTDDTAISTWYANNCGSDNGASEHGGGGGGGGTGTGGGSAPPSSSTAPTSSSGSTDSGTSEGSSSSCGGSWWHCHWQWIVMVIVIALGLCVLGFGGRWLKKRYDRKRDRMTQAFNAGITSRTAPASDDKDPGFSSDSSGAAFEAGAGVDAPARTREAFMPYGYGYTRSESRNEYGQEGPITRGGTPFEDMEKGDAYSRVHEDPSAKGKLRRVLVREKSLR